jgi:hypothetical protein
MSTVLEVVSRITNGNEAERTIRSGAVTRNKLAEGAE